MTDQPHDIGAERCTVAAMIQCGDDRVTFSRIRRQLWPGAFFNPDLGVIFRTLCQMADADVDIDAVSLRGKLKEKGVFEELGGNGFLAELLETLPTYKHGPTYAADVAKLARKRDAIAVMDATRAMLIDPHGEPGDEVIQNAINRLWKASSAGRDLNIWRLGEALARFVEKRTSGERAVSLASGVAELDNDYQGIFTFGGYTLIAARPSMGKSTAIRWLLKTLSEAGTPVGIIAVEENQDKIAGNVLSAHTEIENSHIAYGKLTNNDSATHGRCSRP